MRISYWSSDLCSSDLSHTEVDYARGLDGFEHTLTRLADRLGDAFQSVHRLQGAALLEYLKSTISSRWHQVGLFEPPAFLGYLLSDEPLRGGLYPHLGDQHLRVVGLKRSAEHTSELQSLMRISYAVFCL